MVKHGRNRKRRAGRIGKTKLKNKNFARWDPNPKIGDKIIKKNWDVTKSPAKNFAAMGLSLQPNSSGSSSNNNKNSRSTDDNKEPIIMMSLADVANNKFRDTDNNSDNDSASTASDTPNSNETSEQMVATTAATDNKKENNKVIDIYHTQSVVLSKKREAKKNSRPALGEKDQEYIAKCISKWGTTNTMGMFRDTRGVNQMQHTHQKIETMVQRFLDLKEEHRKVPWPIS